MEALTAQRTALGDELHWLSRQARPRRLRSMLAFAEQEIVLPSGPREGRRFRSEWQPYTRLLFREIDSGRWSRIVVTGPTQSGKSMSAFVIPAMYHLFEVSETVILGLPSLDMAGDKWMVDLRPAIEASRYRDLLPRKGPGSRGGRVDAIQFRNGRVLKFMTGGGGDKSRAGFTSRVLIITETDGMDVSSETSREADKITQLEARTRAYGSRKRVYMECTVSTTVGRTWRELKAGTDSRIALPCPHCGEWVVPERADLRGWREAANEAEAHERSAFHCPSCEAAWSEEDRSQANARGVLVHRGQEVKPSGEVVGPLPATATLGFRWSAVNNLFATVGDLAGDEWRASRATDGDNAEREQCQFVWALPHDPDVTATTSLEVEALQKRVRDIPRGVVPENATRLSMGIDCGKWLCHWVLVAWGENATGHVVDYGRFDVPTDQFGVEKALVLALREFRDTHVEKGWPVGNVDGPVRSPDQVWIDAGYQTTTAIYPFIRETRSHRYRPAVGRGHGQQHVARYERPKKTGALIRFIGEEYHVVWLPKERVFLVEVNADHWKSWIHQRLSVRLDEAGALGLFPAAPHEHLAFAHHMTSERQIEEFLAGKGVVVRWQTVKKANHWFDAIYNAGAASHLAGVRLLPQEVKVVEPRTGEEMPVVTPHGQPFLATERN